MRRGLRVVLAVVLMGAAWFVLVFVAAPALVFGSVVFVGLDQVLGRTTTGVLAGALAGIGLGLAPSWARPRFWLGVAAGAAIGFGLERATGFLAGQLSLDERWAAFSFAVLGGMVLEGLAQSSPAPAGLRPARLAIATVLGAALGVVVVPTSEEPGPAALRIVFALGHVLACCFLRHGVAAEGARLSRA